ncbi:MAG: hypothetical protein IKA47_12320 [Oscillospiraceae bacterium]|nr:hypothetical protein [Oscillospiraceae bacterium]
MFFAIICFILYCIGYFLCKYGNDSISFANGKIDKLSPPSVSDLPYGTDVHIIDTYVSHKVIPLKDFADYERSISQLVPDSTSALFTQLFIEGVPFALCIKSLQHYLTGLPSLENSGFLCWLFAIFAAVLCFGTARYAIKKLYNAFLKIPAFQLSPDELEEHFNQSPIEFPVSRRTAFKNHVISAYLAYYEQYFPSLQVRHRISTIMDYVLAIIYLLFFFRAP